MSGVGGPDPGDPLDLLLDRPIERIEGFERSRRAGRRLDDLLGQLDRAVAAETEDVRGRARHAPSLAEVVDDLAFFGRVGPELVDGDQSRFVEVLRGVEVRPQVREPAFDRRRVGVREGVERRPAVHFQGSDRGDDHDGRGVQVGGPALDVEELLGAEVESEPGFGDGILAERHRHPGRQDRVAAVGDVCERPAVDEGGRPFLRLDEVRQQGVFQDRGERPRHAHLARQDGLTVGRVADEDPVEACPEVARGVGEAEDRHDLARGGDIETRLARNPAHPRPAEPDYELPECPVVHVERPPPEHPARVERGVAEVETVVDRGGQEVVRGGDGVEVAGELQVDLVRRGQPTGPAPRRAPLPAENRTHRRLPERQDRLLADLPEPLRQADRGRRLPFARWCRGDGRDQDQLSGRIIGLIQSLEPDLGFVFAVGLDVIVGDPEGAGHFGDGAEFGSLGRHIEGLSYHVIEASPRRAGCGKNDGDCDRTNHPFTS